MTTSRTATGPPDSGNEPGNGAVHPESLPQTTVLVDGTVTAGRLALLIIVERPGDEPPCHCHSQEDELLYVIEGTLAVYRAGQWSLAQTGSVVLLPRNVEHTYCVMSPIARVLALFFPAGFEGFYSDLGTTAWVTSSTTEVERLIVTAALYGCEITGPHPGPPPDKTM